MILSRCNLLRVVIMAAVIITIQCSKNDVDASSKNTPAPQRSHQITENQPVKENGGAESRSAAAMERATEQGHYLLMLFAGGESGLVEAMRDSMKAVVAVPGNRIDTVSINVADPAESFIVKKYGIGQQGGLPVLLVRAPNDVITGGFPQAASTEQIRQSTSVSDLMLKTLKPLQEQKVALVALQNSTTKFNAESWRGVEEFAGDANNKSFVTAIKADPAHSGSAEFIQQCRLLPTLTEATVVILLPPGRIGNILTGKTSKEEIARTLQACTAGSGCCP